MEDPSSFGSVLFPPLALHANPLSRLTPGSSGPFLHPRPCISWVLLTICLVRRPHLYVHTQGSACFLNFTSHSQVSSLVWLLPLLTSALWHGSPSHVFKQTQVRLSHTLQCSKPFNSPVSSKEKYCQGLPWTIIFLFLLYFLQPWLFLKWDTPASGPLHWLFPVRKAAPQEPHGSLFTSFHV